MVIYRLKIPDRLDFILALPVLLYRRLRHGHIYRRIPLTQGLYAKVDPDMFYEVIKYKWYARKSTQTYYATSTQYQNGRRCDLHMHRLIMELVIASEAQPPRPVPKVRLSGLNAVRTTQYSVRNKLPDNLFIDHINGDGFDNRRANLRLATSTQNNYNRRITSRLTSKYKGVDYRPSKKAYRARITVNKKKIFLGYFPDEISAAKAYDIAAKKYHKQFAVSNFPD
jgi:hypothetical protein